MSIEHIIECCSSPLQRMSRFFRNTLYGSTAALVLGASALGCSDGQLRNFPPDMGQEEEVCTDNDKDNFYAQKNCGTEVDCDDANKFIFPGAEELCDFRDNNCDTKVDENIQKSYFPDRDKDLYGDDANIVLSCSQPPPDPKEGISYVSRGGDCDDTNSEIHPKAEELCDRTDNNCNTQIDEGFDVGNVCYSGKGECKTKGLYTCSKKGRVICDAIAKTPTEDPTEETCDGLDNDCDGEIDNIPMSMRPSQGCTMGIGECADSGLEYALCLGEEGWSPVYVGCDADPGDSLPEMCDGLDNNCNTMIDEDEVCGRACSVVADQVGYWNFDEEDGDIAYDSSGNELHGTIYGGASRVPGIFRTTLDLDGTDDYISVPDHDVLDLTEMTLMAWVKTEWDGVREGRVIDKHDDDGSDTGYAITVSDGRLEGIIRGRRYASSSTMPADSWVPIAMTLNNEGRLRLYLDLVIDAEYTVDAPAVAGTLPLSFGVRGNSSTHFFVGRLDELRIYSCALSPAQIAEFYTGE